MTILRGNGSVRALAALAALGVACGGNIVKTGGDDGDGGKVEVMIRPVSPQVKPAGLIPLRAYVAGAASGVTWSVVEADGGSVGASDGVYVAPARTGVFHVVAESTASPGVRGTAEVTVTSTPAAPNLFGFNFSSPIDFMPGQVYADVMRQSRDITVAAGGAGVAMDSDWYPLVGDFRIGVATAVANMHGTYAFSATGQVTSLRSSGTTVSGPDYDAGSNTTTATFRFTDATPSLNIQITVAGARRNDGSGQLGLTNIKLMRPLSPGSTETHATTELFNRNLKAILSKVKVVRFMDFLGTSGNQIATWSDRPRPSWMSFSPGDSYTDRSLPGDAWQGRGGPLEHVVLLSNEMGTDAWINLPHRADDDYVLKTAQLFAYGSDGNLPFTGPYGSAYDAATNPRPAPHDPATWTPGTTSWYPPLDPALNLYVEYSNEIWNSAAPFVIESNWVLNAARTEIAAGGSDLAYDGRTDRGGSRFVARRLVQISKIFRSVFGDAQMPLTGSERIRPILAAFVEIESGWLGQGLAYLWEYWNNGDGVSHVADPHPPRYYVWGGGGTSYCRPGNDWTVNPVTLDNLWQSNQMDLQPGGWFRTAIARGSHYTYGYGLKRVAYEGGPDFGQYQGNASVMQAAVNDPRLATWVEDWQQAWSEMGGELNVLFSAVYGWEWGWATDVTNPVGTQRMVGLDRLTGAPAAAPTLGIAVPGSGPGAAHSSGGGNWWLPNPSATGTLTYSASAPERWANYVFRAADAAVRTIQLTLSGGSSGTVAVYVDGVLLGTRTAADGTIAVEAGVVDAGLHGVTVRAASGRFVLDRIAMQ